MAIERMSFVEISGDTARLDDVLEHCLNDGIFQPEHAAKLSEYSIGAPALMRNPYGGLLIKLTELSAKLGVALGYADSETLPEKDGDRGQFVERAFAYLSRLELEHTQHYSRRKQLSDEMASYDAALGILAKVRDPAIDFDEVFAGDFLKVRFGRIPTANIDHIGQDQPCTLLPLGVEEGDTWCLYITAPRYSSRMDTLLQGLGFVRLRIPDFVHGTAEHAREVLQKELDGRLKLITQSLQELSVLITREQQHFLMLYSRTKFLHDAYDLRKYAVSIRNEFHMVGFVPTRQLTGFIEGLNRIGGIETHTVPAEDETRVGTPVKLRNNWLVRPYEMFVNMYGTPSYKEIDPTPFVAYTYTLLFGIMFGDLGQGLCICLLGLFLYHKKKMPLGGILSRIGVASMCFGVLYGSVFGFENALDPLYRALGLHEKPIEVMHPDTTTKLLVAAVALGTVIILMAMVFNMCVAVKRRDLERLLLSSNGVPGFVFYGSVLAAVIAFLRGKNVLSIPYILALLVLPLILIFLKEPLGRLMRDREGDTIIQHHKTLMESTVFKGADTHLHELFTTEFVSSRFGRIPTNSYEKLHFYGDEPFLLYPLKSGREYIWCIYTMPVGEQERIDAIFQGLYFERIQIPDESLETSQEAERFIKNCIDSGSEAAGEAGVPRKNTFLGTLFPDGVGAFVTESFFELFEVLLSFVTNTMSFLRVGGFILSHAGMMSVVFTLSEMVGAGVSPLVIIGGNVFVMCLEGLIVGIQVLRLEFYEIFSRFFDADGDAYAPVHADYQSRAG